MAALFFSCFVLTIPCLQIITSVWHLGLQTRDGILLSSIIQAVIMFILPSLLSARILSQRPMKFLELNKMPSFLSMIGVVFAYLIAIPAINQVIYWNSILSFPESMTGIEIFFKQLEESASASADLILQEDSIGGLIVNLLVVGLLTAFGEEIFFRGTLQRAAASSGAATTAIWVVAIIFSAMHLQFYGFVPRLLLGAWFGYLLYWTGSLYVPIFAHFLNNGIVVLFAWLSARGMPWNFEGFGVTEYGFPMPAFVSALAFIIFVCFFRGFFFGRDVKSPVYYG